jgi:hypothetical protein
LIVAKARERFHGLHFALTRLTGNGPGEVVDDEGEVRIFLQDRLHQGRAAASPDGDCHVLVDARLPHRLEFAFGEHFLVLGFVHR